MMNRNMLRVLIVTGIISSVVILFMIIAKICYNLKFLEFFSVAIYGMVTTAAAVSLLFITIMIKFRDWFYGANSFAVDLVAMAVAFISAFVTSYGNNRLACIAGKEALASLPLLLNIGIFVIGIVFLFIKND